MEDNLETNNEVNNEISKNTNKTNLDEVKETNSEKINKQEKGINLHENTANSKNNFDPKVMLTMANEYLYPSWPNPKPEAELYLEHSVGRESWSVPSNNSRNVANGRGSIQYHCYPEREMVYLMKNL